MADAADTSTRSTPLVVLTMPSSPSSNGRPRTTSAFSHITQVPPAECVTTCATLADVLVTSPITLHNNNNNTTSSHSGSHPAAAAGTNLRVTSTSNSKDNVTQASPTLSSSARSVTQAPHSEGDKAAQPPILHGSSRRQGSTATGTNTSSSGAAMTSANVLNDTLSSLSVTRSADPLSATQSPCEAALPAAAEEERARRTTRASAAEQPIPVSRQGSNAACATRAAQEVDKKCKEEEEKGDDNVEKRTEGQSGYDAADMHTPLPFPDFTPPVSPTAQSSAVLPEAAKATDKAAAAAAAGSQANAKPAIESHAATAAVNKAKTRSGLPSRNDTPRTAVLQANTPPPPGVATNTNSSAVRTLAEVKKNNNNNNANPVESARHTPIPLRPPVQITHAADAAVPLPCFMQNASTVMPSSTSCNGLTWNSNNSNNNSNSNNNNPLFASFAHMNASGSSTALDEVQWSLRLMKSVNDNHAATTDDCMSDQLYRLLRAPPSCTLGNTDDFRVFFHTLMTVYRHDDLLPWETVVWLLRPGDQIRYKSMFAPMQCIDLDDFLRFVELASVRLRRI